MLLCTHRTRRFTSLLVGPIGGLDAGTIIENVELRTAPASCLFELAAVYDVVDVVFMNCVDCENLGLDFFGVCSLRRSFCLRVAIAFKVVECVFFLCPALPCPFSVAVAVVAAQDTCRTQHFDNVWRVLPIRSCERAEILPYVAPILLRSFLNFFDCGS